MSLSNRYFKIIMFTIIVPFFLFVVVSIAHSPKVGASEVTMPQYSGLNDVSCEIEYSSYPVERWTVASSNRVFGISDSSNETKLSRQYNSFYTKLLLDGGIKQFENRVSESDEKKIISILSTKAGIIAKIDFKNCDYSGFIAIPPSDFDAKTTQKWPIINGNVGPITSLKGGLFPGYLYVKADGTVEKYTLLSNGKETDGQNFSPTVLPNLNIFTNITNVVKNGNGGSTGGTQPVSIGAKGLQTATVANIEFFSKSEIDITLKGTVSEAGTIYNFEFSGKFFDENTSDSDFTYKYTDKTCTNTTSSSTITNSITLSDLFKNQANNPAEEYSISSLSIKVPATALSTNPYPNSEGYCVLIADSSAEGYPRNLFTGTAETSKVASKVKNPQYKDIRRSQITKGYIDDNTISELTDGKNDNFDKWTKIANSNLFGGNIYSKSSNLCDADDTIFVVESVEKPWVLTHFEYKTGQPCNVESSFTKQNIVEYALSKEDFKNAVTNTTNTNDTINNAKKAEEDQKDCLSSSILGWVLCPVVEGLYNSLDTLVGPGGNNSFLTNLLIVDPLRTEENGNETALYRIWKSFRTIANILFVLVFLLVIFGQATSFVDAYTLKKALPRLFIAAIGVNLSWFFCGIMIDIFNVLGSGVAGIMIAPVSDSPSMSLDFIRTNKTLDVILTGGAIVGVGAAIASGAIVGFLLMLVPILMGAVSGILLAMVTLIFRRALILLLIVTSPIAIVCWILPNTEDVYKKWWNFFSKALVMYPLIIALLASGKLFASVVLDNNTQGGASSTGFYEGIVALIANFAPYFLIPATFKFAGSLIGQVANIANDKSKGLLDRPTNWSKNVRNARSQEKARNRQIRDASAIGENRTWKNSLAKARATVNTGTWGSSNYVGRAVNKGTGGLIRPGANARNISNQRASLGIAGISEAAKTADMNLDTAYFDDPNSEFILADGSRTKDKRSAQVDISAGKKVRVIGGDNKERVIDGTSAAVRSAVINRAARQGDVGAINTLMGSVPYEDRYTRQILNQAVASNYGSLGSKAPHLFKGPAGAYSDIKAGDIAALHSSSIKVMFDYLYENSVSAENAYNALSSNPSANPADVADAYKKMNDANLKFTQVGHQIATIAKDPQLIAQMAVSSRAALSEMIDKTSNGLVVGKSPRQLISDKLVGSGASTEEIAEILGAFDRIKGSGNIVT